MCSLLCDIAGVYYFLNGPVYVNLVISCIDFEGGILVLFATVPGHCILVTFSPLIEQNVEI